MFTLTFWTDAAERVGGAAVYAVLGVVVDQALKGDVLTLDWRTLLAAGVVGAGGTLKALLARKVGDYDSASFGVR